jgi:hypothetical protein
MVDFFLDGVGQKICGSLVSGFGDLTLRRVDGTKVNKEE